MKYKTITRADWTRITERKEAYMPFALGDMRGEAGLLMMERVSAPFIVTSINETLTLVDDGYSWLQLAPEDKHFWLTVMFGADGKLLQYYFDISYENRVRMPGKSGFFDLYLDVVLKPGGEMLLMDESELEDAVRAGDITPDMAAMAQNCARRLMDGLEGNEPILNAACVKMRAALMDKLR